MAGKQFALGQLGDQELKQLRVFKSVVDCAGFSAAETQLNISRTTISTHIANLEARLNLTLCKRGRGGFELTDEGAVIYEQTEKLLNMLDSFRNTVNNLAEQPGGRLRIGLSDTFSADSRCNIPRIVQAFGDIAPDVELRLSVEHMASMERKILNDELDIAFIPYHRSLEGLSYQQLFTDRCYLYCGEDNPLFQFEDADLTEAVLNAAPLVHAGLKPHEGVIQQLNDMNLAGVAYHYEARLAMLLSGRYIGFLPKYLATPHVDCGKLKPLVMDRKFYELVTAVAYRKTLQVNRTRQLFIDTVNQVFSETVNDSMG